MPIDFENDATTQDAMARLMDAESTEQAPQKEAFVQSDGGTPEIPDAGGSEKVDKTPSKSSTETPAGAKDEQPAPKQETKPEPEAKSSKFAADKARKDDSWKALNAEKESFKTQQESFKQQQAAFQREQETFTQKKASASRKFTPENYEQAAQQALTRAKGNEEQAEGWEARAEKYEMDGKFTEAADAKAKAKQLRAQAARESGKADDYKDYAEHLRKNPEPSTEQLKAKNEQQIQGYTIEAAKQWPELAKQGSEMQKLTGKNIQDARGQGLDENEFPVIRYYAARLAALELASAGVSEMEKKLGAAEAKVKELEALTAPGGGGKGSVQAQTNPKGWNDKSDEEQGAELRQMAAAMS